MAAVLELQEPPYVPSPARPGTTVMLRRSVRRLREGQELAQGPLAELRAATTCQVWALRDGGLPAERVLERVRASLRDAMDRDGWMDPVATQAVTERVVAWTIAAYFDR